MQMIDSLCEQMKKLVIVSAAPLNLPGRGDFYF